MSRLDAVLKRCEDATRDKDGWTLGLVEEFAAECARDLPDLARDFRVVAEALRDAWPWPAAASNTVRDALDIVNAWLGEAPE